MPHSDQTVKAACKKRIMWFMTQHQIFVLNLLKEGRLDNTPLVSHYGESIDHITTSTYNNNNTQDEDRYWRLFTTTSWKDER